MGSNYSSHHNAFFSSPMFCVQMLFRSDNRCTIVIQQMLSKAIIVANKDANHPVIIFLSVALKLKMEQNKVSILECH